MLVPIKKFILSLMLLLALAGLVGMASCDRSQGSNELASSTSDPKAREDYLRTVEDRLKQIEKEEAELQKSATNLADGVRAEFELRLGQLVEKRVYAKKKLQELKAAGEETFKATVSSLKGSLAAVDQALALVVSSSKK
jgi:hypothetical protein